jgi:hypothetical protein
MLYDLRFELKGALTPGIRPEVEIISRAHPPLVSLNVLQVVDLGLQYHLFLTIGQKAFETEPIRFKSP